MAVVDATPGERPAATVATSVLQQPSMLAARPHIEPRRVTGADSVVVSEIYLSLQGESSHQGLLCSFVRLTGAICGAGGANRPSPSGVDANVVAEVVERVKALGAPRVEVTGGEPLLQPGVYPLMEGCSRRDSWCCSRPPGPSTCGWYRQRCTRSST
jgi:hypothetical protein